MPDQPRIVLLRIRINQNWVGKLKAAGIPMQTRTSAQEYQIIRRHTEQAVAVGRDAFRGQREDAVGFKRPDSGTPIFTWDPQGRVSVDLAMVREDLERNGFKLGRVDLLQKEGDRMGYLCFWYAPDREPCKLVGTQGIVIDTLLSKVYEHLHGFRNPDGSMTFNAAHMLESPAERTLRISPDWSVSCRE